MCRMTLYMGDELSIDDLVTRPENSLINQSVRARERPEPLNGDGFGIAWYVPDQTRPARFRSLTPAWSNANLDELARVTSSHCILAHVRAATGGSFEVSDINCHPFRCGGFTFMHNGHIPGFSRIRRPLMAELSDEGFESIRGNTDSEHVFALISEELRGRESESNCELLRSAICRGIAKVRELIDEHAPGSHCYLNFILSDGRHAAACRYSSDPDYIDSLYVNSGGRYVCNGNECRMEESDETRAVMISSEPLNEGPLWRSIERNHMALINADLEVRLEPV